MCSSSVMDNVFGIDRPQIKPPPPPPPVTPPPVKDVKDNKKKVETNYKKIDKEKKGRRATILTSGEGDTSTPNIHRKTLLGQ